MQASRCKKTFLRTPNIFKFKDILRTGLRQHTTIGCNTHCKTTQQCTSLHFVDRIDRSCSQGRGHQSLEQMILTSLSMYPGSTQDHLWVFLQKVQLAAHMHGASQSFLQVCFHQLGLHLFSERELTFTFAICYRPSVCMSSVTFVRPTQAV